MAIQLDDITLLRFYEDDLPAPERLLVEAALREDPEGRSRRRILSQTGIMLEAAFERLGDSDDGSDRLINYRPDLERGVMLARFALNEPPARFGEAVTDRNRQEGIQVFASTAARGPTMPPSPARRQSPTVRATMKWRYAIAASIIVSLGIAGYLVVRAPTDGSWETQKLAAVPRLIAFDEKAGTLELSGHRIQTKRIPSAAEAVAVVLPPLKDSKVEQSAGVPSDGTDSATIMLKPTKDGTSAIPVLPRDWISRIFGTDDGANVSFDLGPRYSLSSTADDQFNSTEGGICRIARIFLSGPTSLAHTLLACRSSNESWENARIFQVDQPDSRGRRDGH